MKKLLAILLTLALLCVTGIAMAAEAVLPDTIPTITVDISDDGNVTLKTSDGESDYNNVYVYVEDADDNTSYIGLEYNERVGAYVSQESYQGQAAGKNLSNAYVENYKWENTGYSSISFNYNESSELSSASAYISKDEYNEDGIRTSYEYSSQSRNYSDGVISSEYMNSRKTLYDSNGNATSEESESNNKYYNNGTLTQESKDSESQRIQAIFVQAQVLRKQKTMIPRPVNIQGKLRASILKKQIKRLGRQLVIPENTFTITGTML